MLKVIVDSFCLFPMFYWFIYSSFICHRHKNILVYPYLAFVFISYMHNLSLIYSYKSFSVDRRHKITVLIIPMIMMHTNITTITIIITSYHHYYQYYQISPVNTWPSDSSLLNKKIDLARFYSERVLTVAGGKRDKMY